MLDRLFMGAGDSAPTDPNFENVTLLLPGNGTNGAQNNTFLDSSTNNFTVTRNGDTTQGSFSPYGDLWSNYFDGNGDYLASPSNAALQFGTGDYTIEFWCFGKTNSGYLFDSRFTSGGICILQDTVYTGTTSSYTSRGNVGIPDFTWTHVAISRASGTTKVFNNGAQVLSFSDTGNYGSTQVNIGYYSGTGGEYYQGYISNFRMVKGTALYTSAFTPSTTPLTAISGTSLLTCQSNRFRDASANNFAITANGNTSVTNFAPFNPSAAYDPAVNGGSGYFDGAGDYLSTPNNAAVDFGSSNFTIEGFCYPTSTGHTTIVERRSTGFVAGDWVAFCVNGAVHFAAYDFDPVGNAILMSSNAPVNQWFHFAIVRNGTVFTLYINGVSAATYTSSNSFVNNSQGITVGVDNPSGGRFYYSGNISNLRIVKGTAVYTANFTPPTAPVTAITNTSLLLNFTNAGIVDASAKNDLITVGNAQISTAQSKFGGSSMALDGVGGYIIGQSTPDLTLGTGDFTIEFWAYINAQGNYCFYDQRTALNQVLPTIYTQSGQIHYYVSGANRITGSTLSAGQWYHIALTRSGTSTRLFVNGTQVGSTYTDANNYIQSRPVIGAVGDNLANYNLNGYIDDLRITKGVARYTANFTPPTAPFPSK